MASKQAKNVKKALLAGKNIDEILNTPLEEQRKNWEESAFGDVIPDYIIIEEAVISNISVEWIRTNSSDKNHVIMYFHGGGYTQGSIVTHRKLVAHIAKSTNMQILILNYPLAPENPYPAAINSSKQVYLHLLEDGFNSNAIILGGDSSGGGLAAALTLLLKNENILLPKGIFLISPMLDLALSGETIKTCAKKDPLLFEEDMRISINHYLGKESPFNPLASPVYGNIKGFPPLLIQVGSDELLLSDSIRFTNIAKAEQVSVQLSVWEEMWHVFQTWVDDVPEAVEAIEEIGQFVKSICRK